jgi:hypothetical protein
MFQNRDCFVVDGENFEDVNKMCGFLFSSKINMDESVAKRQTLSVCVGYEISACVCVK